MKIKEFRYLISMVKIIIMFILPSTLLLNGCGNKKDSTIDQVSNDQSKKKEVTIDQIAYDQCNNDNIVYIKENDIYTPYLVITSDYYGNVLLLRKNLLDETMPYKKSNSAGWAYSEYASYYEESSIDEFLNSQFLDTMSDTMKNSIVTSRIEVTSKDSYFGEIGNTNGMNRNTHSISRKVFLLSANELDYYVEDEITLLEGTALKFFVDDNERRGACFADGTFLSYWTRTPLLSDTFIIDIACKEGCGDASAEADIGVRPAFCVSKDIIIKKSSEVIKGESVNIIE